MTPNPKPSAVPHHSPSSTYSPGRARYTTVSIGGGGRRFCHVCRCLRRRRSFRSVSTNLACYHDKSMTLSFTPELCKSMMSDVLEMKDCVANPNLADNHRRRCTPDFAKALMSAVDNGCLAQYGHIVCGACARSRCCLSQIQLNVRWCRRQSRYRSANQSAAPPFRGPPIAAPEMAPTAPPIKAPDACVVGVPFGDSQPVNSIAEAATVQSQKCIFSYFKCSCSSD